MGRLSFSYMSLKRNRKKEEGEKAEEMEEEKNLSDQKL